MHSVQQRKAKSEFWGSHELLHHGRVRYAWLKRRESCSVVTRLRVIQKNALSQRGKTEITSKQNKRCVVSGKWHEKFRARKVKWSDRKGGRNGLYLSLSLKNDLKEKLEKDDFYYFFPVTFEMTSTRVKGSMKIDRKNVNEWFFPLRTTTSTFPRSAWLPWWDRWCSGQTSWSQSTRTSTNAGRCSRKRG